MSASASFVMLQQLARKRRDECAARLGRAITELNGACAQQKLLTDYHEDYGRRLQEASRQGIAGAGLRNYQSFLAHLERAIEQQGALVGQLEGRVMRLRTDVAREQRQMDSYAVMLRRRADAQVLTDNRRQQSLLDEFATNGALRLAASRDGGND